MKMMKFFLLAAAAVAAISCAKENLPVENETPTTEVELVPMTFTASHDAGENPETKVAYENGLTAWKVGDMIKVIAPDGTATDFKAIEVTNEGKTATFEGLTVENANEYYAVYPASAYKGTPEYVTDAAGGKLVVEVPHVQQAVAGTFHESAILCIANTKGNVFNFKHSCAFFKFNIAVPEGVKSVRLKVNGSDNVAGIGYVGVNATDMNPKYAGSDANLSKYDIITLNAPEGGFEAGKDYFIAMRANSCPSGVTLYIEYEDGVKYRATDKRMFPAQNPDDPDQIYGSIGKIRNLGQLDKNLNDITPYEVYTLGFDIMVAGKAINKSTYGDATLVTKAQGLNNNGVYFINSDVEGVSMNSSKSIVAIGNDPDKRSKVSRSGYSYIPATADEDYWILSNIDFNITSASTYTLRLNGGNVCEMIIMNNCSSNVPSATQYIYGDANNKAKEIIIKDSEFLVEAASTNNFLNFAATQTIDAITFDNNVFYSADITAPATSFTLISAGNTTVTNALINKNTFYGAYPAIGGGNIINCKSNSMTVTNNMFGLNKGTDTNNVFVVGGKISEIMNFSNNAYFKNSAAKSILTVTTSNAAPTGTNDGISSKAISTDGWNPAEDKFVINSSYGATR